MDQTHARAIEALQPFIYLAKSNSPASPRFVAQIITNATSSPNTYVFAELLETPTIQSLSSPETPTEYQGYLKLLEIFAWGTWQDYQDTPNLPTLSTEQSQKLRLLTLLTLATTTKPLTYKTLQSTLSLPNAADIESLVTTAIYRSLITARLSPASANPSVNVTAIAPLRDVQPQSFTKTINLLSDWETRCGEVIRDLEAEIEAVKNAAAERAAKEKEYQQMLEKKTAERKKEIAAKEAGAAAGRRKEGSAFRRALGMGNKREAEDIEEDDGFFDAGDGMDIDEGAGAGSASGSGRGVGSRTKRLLGGRKA